MNIRLLDPSEHNKTRVLWEEVFSEDTEIFLDYYYEHMTDHNQIWVVENPKEDKIVSMLHLNPYEMQIGTQLHPASYIVAVATEEASRRKGYMGELLKRSMAHMYEMHMPFTYLMPAAEAIYTPYQFVTVAGQEHYEYTGQMLGQEFEELAPDTEQEYAVEEDCVELAEFANEQLAKTYDIFTHRSASYYRQLIKEQESQNGGIVLVRRKGELIGYFLVSAEEKVIIREPVFDYPYDFSLRLAETPKMMVRILHLETLLRCMTAEVGKEVILEVYDSILTMNTGVYKLNMESDGMHCEKIEDEVDMRSAVSIETVTQMIFGKEKILLNEIV